MLSALARAEDSSDVDALIKRYLETTPREEWKGSPVTSQPTPTHEADYSDLGRIIGISIVVAAGGGLWKKRKKQSNDLSTAERAARMYKLIDSKKLAKVPAEQIVRDAMANGAATLCNGFCYGIFLARKDTFVLHRHGFFIGKIDEK